MHRISFMLSIRVVGLLLLNLIVATHAFGGVLDQELVVSPTNTAQGIADNVITGQTFTVGRTGLLDRFEIQMGHSEGVNHSLLIELRHAVAGLPDFTPAGLLYSITATPSQFPVGHPSTLVGFDLGAQAFAVSAGDVLAISATSSQPFQPLMNSPLRLYTWVMQIPGQYSGGSQFRQIPLNSPNFSVLLGNDLGFRTFVTPEPNSAVLLGTMILCGGFRRVTLGHHLTKR